MTSSYQITQPGQSFARTNRQTIRQRARLLEELGFTRPAIAEICCGDCRRQQRIYAEALGTRRYRGLDLSPAAVALNRAHGVDCVRGDALDEQVMAQFTSADVLFFGPPLSEQCDGHSLLPFHAVTPGFAPFTRLLLGQLQYEGLVVCICPNSTNMGEIRWLYHQIREVREDVGLRLIHRSYATLTGNDEETEMRLKYVELWWSAELGDRWQVRASRGAG